MTLFTRYLALSTQQLESREDMRRIQKIRKQLEESQDIETVRSIARPLLERMEREQWKTISGETP